MGQLWDKTNFKIVVFWGRIVLKRWGVSYKMILRELLNSPIVNLSKKLIFGWEARQPAWLHFLSPLATPEYFWSLVLYGTPSWPCLLLQYYRKKHVLNQELEGKRHSEILFTNLYQSCWTNDESCSWNVGERGQYKLECRYHHAFLVQSGLVPKHAISIFNKPGYIGLSAVSCSKRWWGRLHIYISWVMWSCIGLHLPHF